MVLSEDCQQSLPHQVVLQAIQWRVRMESGSATEAENIACQRWRNECDHHELAWQRLMSVDGAFHQASMRAPTLAHKTLQNTEAERRLMARRHALKVVGGSAFGVMALGLGVHHSHMLDAIKSDFHTVKGERSQITLADTSTLWINSDSALSVNFTERERTVRLARGEISVNAVMDSRPFSVTGPYGSFSATDTHFVVRHERDSSLVQVVNGSVLIQPKYARSVVEATSGQVFKMSADDVSPIDNQMFDYNAWTEGLLSVKNMPLKSLLAELSRYHKGFLRCDPSLDDFPISGVFQLHDANLVLKVLARSSNSEVRYVTRWWATLVPVALS